MGSHSQRRKFLASGVGLAGLVMGAVRSLRGQTATPAAPPKDALALRATLSLRQHRSAERRARLPPSPTRR